MRGENGTWPTWRKKQSSLKATRKFRSWWGLKLQVFHKQTYSHNLHYSNIMQVTTSQRPKGKESRRGRQENQESHPYRPGRKALDRQNIPICKSMHLLKPVCSFSFPYHIQSRREKFLLEVKQFSPSHSTSTAMAPFLPQDTTLQCPSEHLRVNQGTQLPSPRG